MNQLVIFDCFGVICSEIAPKLFSHYYDKDQAIIEKNKYFIPADLGEITLEDVFDGLSEDLKLPRQTIADEWNSYIGVNAQLVEFIRKLRKTCDVALLSNATKGLVEGIFDKYGLNDLFDVQVISYKLHLAKPDPQIYKVCLSKFNKKYDRIIMTDDNPANLEPLPALGITPVLFTGNEDFFKYFE
ncbi:MAG: HAD-IA family hydrolase [Corallococcus sp.]|nr:HAD-IA family hydrolase [Corallococcus sp.]